MLLNYDSSRVKMEQELERRLFQVMISLSLSVTGIFEIA